jgi:multiple sugar transport system substrate-binding protein
MAQSQTFLMPIAEHGAQVEELMNSAIEAVLLGQQPAGPALAAANAQVNRLLATRPGQRRP